ncbi:MAG: ankyrin repeat domain-containing protein [Gammaproteobacteria bacterium]|nr:ankyrin repeat domain-containing protein [Gammaproteobacteria bacterium]
MGASQLNKDFLQILINDNDELLGKKLNEQSIDIADINKIFLKSVLGGHNRCIDLLLNKGANVNFVLPMGENALTWAISRGHMETCRLLIEKNINVNKKTSIAHTTPLMCAARSGKLEIIQALVDAGAKLDDQNKLGQTALMIATGVGESEAVVLLESLMEPSSAPESNTPIDIKPFV